ncbi:MAG: HAD family hydrolase [bacterium]|nr:HAD family hydrolase [bacterium]
MTKNIKSALVNIDIFDKEEDVATMIRRIYVDLDNTLLPTEGNLPPKFFAYADKFLGLVYELRQSGVFVKLCTGRDHNSVEMATRALGLLENNQFFVIEDGVARFNPTTKVQFLNPALTPEILEAFERVHREWTPRILLEFPELFEYKGNLVVVNFELKHGVTTPVEFFYKKIKKLLEPLVEQSLLEISNSGFSVDIKPVANGVPINKAHGIRWDTTEERVSLPETLYIGDSMGDESAVRTTGYAACVGNAKGDFKAVIRELGGHVSDYQYIEGVVDTIEQLVFSRKPKLIAS